MLSAARTLGIELHVLNAIGERDFDAVYRNLVQLRAGGLVAGADTFLDSLSKPLGAWAASHAVPAVGAFHDFALAGGLASYGGSITDSYRLAGVYTGRVLKEARRIAGAAGDKNGAGHQSEGSESAWHHCSVVTFRSCRRGDRVNSRDDIAR